MNSFIYNLCTSAFDVLIYYYCMYDILEQRFQKRYPKVLVLAAMGAILIGANSLDSSVINLYTSTVLYYSVAFTLFNDTIKARLLYPTFFGLVTFGMEFVGGYTYMLIKGGDLSVQEDFPFDLLLLAVSVKLVGFAILRTAKMFINKKGTFARGKFVNAAFIMTFTTMVVYAGLFYADVQIARGKEVLCAGLILLLFSNVLVFYILERLDCTTDQNREYELMALQNDWSRTYYDKLEDVSSQHRKYIHNLKEYLAVIGELAGKGQTDEIKTILTDMEVEINSISDKRYSSNSILNAILCEKELAAQRAGVTIDIKVDPGMKTDFIKSGDMIIMLGNLLQNAIEAARQCSGGHIDLKFFESDGNFLVLNIENDYSNEIRKEGERYLSSKRDGTQHGMGIKSVEEAAGRYGGILYTEQKDGKFIAIMTISKIYKRS